MSKKKTPQKGKNAEKGFVISIEAVISLIIFSLIILSIALPQKVSLIELSIIQQQNDLLRVWGTKETTEQEIINDAKQLLGENVSLIINSKEVLLGKKTNTCYSSSGEMIYETGKMEITIISCY